MGGRNARCLGPTDTAADCDVVVPAIGIDDAAQIYYTAWGMLTEDADYCEAQAATIVAAEAAFPGSERHLAAAVLGWAAVGPKTDHYPGDVGNACAGNLPKLTLSSRSVALADGQSAEIDVTNLGSSETLSVTAEGPVSAELAESDADTVLVSVPEGTARGAYYLFFEGTTE